MELVHLCTKPSHHFHYCLTIGTIIEPTNVLLNFVSENREKKEKKKTKQPATALLQSLGRGGGKCYWSMFGEHRIAASLLVL